MSKITRNLLMTAVLAIVPLFCHAADFEVDGISYNITSETDKTCEVTSKSQKYSGEVNIPSSVTYEGTTYNVTSIGESAFYGCSNLTGIAIPNSVKNIREMAFYNCSSLTSITIPDGVTSIESGTFAFCSGLTNISISSYVTSIGEYAFYGCVNLGISVSPDNPMYCSNDGILFNKDSTILICFSGKITEYVIPNSVTCIENGAFAFFFKPDKHNYS